MTTLRREPAAATRLSRATDPRPGPARPAPAEGAGTWVIVPTYNEAENVRTITAGILESLPGATVLVVDEGSPEGTGRIADELAAAEPRIRVRHRPEKQARAGYLDGFGVPGGRGRDRDPDGRGTGMTRQRCHS